MVYKQKSKRMVKQSFVLIYYAYEIKTKTKTVILEGIL